MVHLNFVNSQVFDPIPGCIWRYYIEMLLPIVAKIINLSVEIQLLAVMPNDFEDADI